ncbi:hypothetical protein NARC_30097 [Candidatus Nitrosocosmicus arcticus]|uniref:Uncharacterized protein n=1 Tax=Candidatus Nitrosocosmicus arcticus TaxID=2035267 RepID=A0A557SXR9_9ARCH|nr:hypothetical protein NARC_30097 [Candidatus Nitrosocosmicus arcticus]
MGEPYEIRTVAMNIPTDLFYVDARITDQNGGMIALDLVS